MSSAPESSASRFRTISVTRYRHRATIDGETVPLAASHSGAMSYVRRGAGRGRAFAGTRSRDVAVAGAAAGGRRAGFTALARRGRRGSAAPEPGRSAGAAARAGTVRARGTGEAVAGA
ncbi:hypothetical protein [Streptomyces antarcticus]|uniref:hypothetical protein n=1 Tax=Streptomyces antarcticus TaxID=2996458 RepID=UPI00226F1CEC|nr:MULTISPECIES: hypothetical protein [unclassified Streptomyces]MCY0943135.1 hypothetical protein [Streptomyces sp. H34-AA3]MCZ4087298.1 hypothetical protein [Streptomyces sp. H34-S5]